MDDIHTNDSATTNYLLTASYNSTHLVGITVVMFIARHKWLLQLNILAGKRLI